MSAKHSDHPRLLLTGATGSIGHYVLAELLQRGCDCVLLLRPSIEKSWQRLGKLLADLGFDVPALIDSGRLSGIEADLADLADSDWPAPIGPIDAVVHTAASTQFQPTAGGDPERTNVRGTQHLLRWMTTHNVNRMHLVSSAYVCGKIEVPVAETGLDAPVFHNAYEQSKWTSEQYCTDWASHHDRTLTIVRPSVVVGDTPTGRSTKFSGFYLCARATELLSRACADSPQSQRQSIKLRLRGYPNDRQNIVPVDYVAAMTAAIVSDETWHGRIYHLTHPDPPSNGQIKEAFEIFFDIGGGRFVRPDAFDESDLNDFERLFWDVSRPIEHYYIDTPDFQRDNTAEVEVATGIHCPAYNETSLLRLIRYAVDSGWGRRRPQRLAGNTSEYTAYFTDFLPAHIARSQVAQMSGLTVSIRFIIENNGDNHWVCCFDKGRLIGVHHGPNTVREDIAYRCGDDVFWEAVAGEVHPQEAFLDGRAEIVGDVELAMKMAMILHAFNREFPCDRRRLRTEAVKG